MNGVDLDVELLQAEQEGRDLASVRPLIRRLQKAKRDPGSPSAPLGGERGAAWLAGYVRLAEAIQALPMRADYPYEEPDALDAIRRARGPARVRVPAGTATARRFGDRLHGGLLGRICGCLLGKPVEGWYRTSIEVTAKCTGNWPINRYLRAPTRTMAARIAQLRPVQRLDEPPAGAPKNRCLLPHISGMVEDDDINYTVLGLAALQRHGAAFTPQDVAATWLNELPLLRACAAERVAYRNLAAGLAPPASATRLNPYREWIGAQIRADMFGYANPGRPERAAEWAWRDASISHVKNGVYGAMWVAAMLAAAAVLDDWEAVIRAGLDQIPERCRLREDVETILALWADGADYGIVCEYIHAQWNERRSHDWHHADANAQVVAAALLWGDDDFGRSVSQAVMCGFDADSNGATVGSLWGVMHGANRIPAAWSRPLRNTLRTGVAGYHEIAIDRLAGEMATVALNLQ
jgi:ADP-ribosylglycohydrolase